MRIHGMHKKLLKHKLQHAIFYMKIFVDVFSKELCWLPQTPLRSIGEDPYVLVPPSR